MKQPVFFLFWGTGRFAYPANELIIALKTALKTWIFEPGD
jgi:hypothetical protein